MEALLAKRVTLSPAASRSAATIPLIRLTGPPDEFGRYSRAGSKRLRRHQRRLCSEPLWGAGLRYRADIDGLRTVAVVPVVLYHAGLPLFSGGYVGVDIFFVISGFLITSVILSDLEKDRFSILGFYERRIRRIFPALIAVLLFCLAIGFILLAPADYAGLGRSVIAAGLFVSNIYFWKSTNYFANEADSEPLLHSWSLSVEEQFYIFHPLLLILLVRRGINLRAVLTTLAVASFVLASVVVFYKQSAAFYLLPTRAWELLLGALLAAGAVPAPRSAGVSRWAALSGAALILIPVVAYTPLTVFPGITAIPPALGAALLIWSGSGAQTATHKLLCTRPFVLIGQASYSLYLWHFPLLAFASYALGGMLPIPVALAACALSLILSLLSLKYIERPFRVRPGLSARAAVSGLGIAMAAAASLAFVVRVDGAPGRLDPIAAAYLQAEADEYRHPKECMSLEAVIRPPDRACRLGASGETPSALLWGDSHAMVTATAMEKAALEAGGSFYFAATADCPPGLGFRILGTSELTRNGSYQYCSVYNQRMLKKALADPNIRAVILSSRWSNWRIGEPANPAEANRDIRLADERGAAATTAGNEAIYRRGLSKLIEALRAAGKQVFIVGPVPEPTYSVPQTLYLRHLGFGPNLRELTETEFQRRHRKALQILEEAQAAGAVLIWPHTALCSHGVCPIVEGQKPMFLDHNHLSVHGAEKTAPLYRPVFQ